MRDAYKACEPFLSTVSQPLEHSSIVKETQLEALKSIAKTMFGIDNLKIKIAKEREVGRELDRDEEIELFENEIRKMREGEDDPQILVSETELESYISKGWEFVSVLPSQMILIRN